MIRHVRHIVLALALALPGAAAADPVTAGALVIEEPWARASIGTERPGVAYLAIRNAGESADTLTAVETPVAAMPELHRTEMTGGTMSMAPAGPITIPPGETVRLEPGGLHAMLMKLTEPLEEGKTLPLTLVFEQAGRVEITVPILGIGARGPDG